MNIQNKNFIKIIVILFLTVSILSCKKGWLEAKPDKSLVVPSTIKDYQAMLDNNSGGLTPINNLHEMLGEIGAGDFIVTDATWDGASTIQKQSYIWASDIYGQDKEYDEWKNQYSNILTMNIILEGIEKIIPNDNAGWQDWNQVKGSALFFRAYRYQMIAGLFCKPYIKSSAVTDLGIPLRLKSDFNETSKRATVEETYAQILSDLKQSGELLPIDKPTSTNIYKLRPTKAAAYAMLARVYLSMRVYDSALAYSNKALGLYNTLMDYNTDPSPSGFFRLPMFNKEVILEFIGGSYTVLATNKLLADTSLTNLYSINDLRKPLFFYTTAFPFFIGTYTGLSNTLFTGLATDELFLIRAECNARMGNKDLALNDLNTLIAKRWNNAVPPPNITASTPNEALQKILIERRKELCFRSLRWSDLRRLNQEPQFAVTLKRTVHGILYSLAPNDNKYVFPIPQDVIDLTGMAQNPR